MARHYHLEPLDAAAAADAQGLGRGFISVPEACELLDCSKSIFEKIVLRDGLVPHGSEFGGIRFHRYKVEALLKPLTPAEANRRMALVVIPGADDDGFRYYRDAARLAGVAPAKVQRWAREKRIPRRERHPRPDAIRHSWWVHPQDVKNYDKRTTTKSAVSDADSFKQFQNDLGHGPEPTASDHHTRNNPRRHR